ncbi:tetratricopeptide repeat protein [Aeromonas sp. R6-2]|uniref:tetratricopeptide repeat protein n=1 Tax=unclassified Aeromonas TaxID=257493 RepID=UPI0034A38462
MLEFLNQYLDSQFDFNEPLPTLVIYYTAKMTKWSEKGLVHLTGVNPMMDECIRELVRFFIPILNSEWYTASGRALIDKAVGIIKDNGLTRDDILLILDNTETLATTSQEVKELGDFFKSVGKLIGRIIITSRRREFIGASPILVEGLSESEAVNLMKALAHEYHAKPVSQAGDKTLRKIANSLNNKPILLEALVKFISRSKIGIDDAVNSVFKKTNEDLLNFLYEDAWARISKQQREVFLISINLSSPLDQISISKICQEVELPHTEFHSSLAETHFAVLTDYGKDYNIELVELAKRFFFHQFSKLDSSEQSRIKSIASSTDVYFTQRMEIENQYRADRVAEAFRTEYAKAAKVYADKGDVNNAVSMYELALEDDPLNSALHDRYSWFLLNKNKDLPYAKKLSEKAIELDENNCDAIVVLAIIHYRLNDLISGDKFIDLANKKGRSFSFCLLRKAIARYHKARDDMDFDSRIDTLEVALALLDKAEKNLPLKGGYDAKNRSDITDYIAKCKKLLITTKGQRTKFLLSTSKQSL